MGTGPSLRAIAIREWAAIITSALTLAAVVWKGGEMSQIIRDHQVRLDKLEALGSSQLQTHVQVAEEIRKHTEARLQVVERAIMVIPTIRESLVAIERDLDYLTRRRETQTKTTTTPQDSTRNY